MSYEQDYQALYDELKAQGWKIYKAYPHGEAELDYYACRTPKHVQHDCICNEKKPLFMAEFWHFYPGIFNNPSVPDQRSASVSISGQIPNDLWPSVKVSCSWEQLLDPKYLDSLDKILSAAYEASYTEALSSFQSSSAAYSAADASYEMSLKENCRANN